MSDRRRAPRYVLHAPLVGDVMPMEDAMVERFDDDRLVVIADSAPRAHEALMVHVATPGGSTSHRAEVMTSRPVTLGGALCFRVELRVSPAEPGGGDPPPSGEERR